MNRKRPAPPTTIEVQVACDVIEFALGCLKTVKYERDALALDGKTLHRVTETM